MKSTILTLVHSRLGPADGTRRTHRVVYRTDLRGRRHVAAADRLARDLACDHGHPTGSAASADNAHTLSNLVPGTAAFRSRPNLIFANGFDANNPCPGIAF